MAAREKSNPRERRGRILAGDPNVSAASSLGESGTRFRYLFAFGDIVSRGGICKERPRAGNAGRLGVVGLASMAVSSCDFFLMGSRKSGEGDKIGGSLSASASIRIFDGEPILPSNSPLPGPADGGAILSASFNWTPSMMLM